MPRFQSTRSRSLKQINKYTIQLPSENQYSENKPQSLKNHVIPTTKIKQNQKSQKPSSKNIQNQYYALHQRDRGSTNTPVYKYRPNKIQLPSNDILQLKKDLSQTKQQLSVKKRQLNSLKDKLMRLKSYESQLVQAYRVINYYEGKVLELERIIQEKNMTVESKQQLKNKIEQSIDSYQKKNIELSAKLQQSTYQIKHLEQKVNKQQLKYKQLLKKYKQNQNKNIQTNQIILNQDKEKMKILYNRLQNIQTQLKFLSQYNDEIQSENASLQQKNNIVLKQNGELKQKIREMEYKLRKKSEQIKVVKTQHVIPPMPKKTTIPTHRASLPSSSQDKKPYQQSKTTDKNTQSNQFSSIEDKKQSYVNKIPFETLQRLRFNLMQSQLSHLKFFQQIKDKLDDNKFLMASPYNLSFEESMTIINELKNNMSDLEEYPKFKEIIPPYYIFLSDRKNAYLTVTSNIFKTNEDEIKAFLKDEQNRECSLDTLTKLLSNWGMTIQQVQFVHLKSYELTNNILPISLAQVSSFFLTI